AYLHPGAVLDQIRDTLARHGIGAAEVDRAMRDPSFDVTLPAGLPERILGPGRLGISLATADSAKESDAVVAEWAPRAGTDARGLRVLLALFASESHAGICLAGAPRCNACGVVSC